MVVIVPLYSHKRGRTFLARTTESATKIFDVTTFTVPEVEIGYSGPGGQIFTVPTRFSSTGFALTEVGSDHVDIATIDVSGGVEVGCTRIRFKESVDPVAAFLSVVEAGSPDVTLFVSVIDGSGSSVVIPILLEPVEGVVARMRETVEHVIATKYTISSIGAPVSVAASVLGRYVVVGGRPGYIQNPYSLVSGGEIVTNLATGIEARDVVVRQLDTEECMAYSVDGRGVSRLVNLVDAPSIYVNHVGGFTKIWIDRINIVESDASVVGGASDTLIVERGGDRLVLVQRGDAIIGAFKVSGSVDDAFFEPMSCTLFTYPDTSVEPTEYQLVTAVRRVPTEKKVVRPSRLDFTYSKCSLNTTKPSVDDAPVPVYSAKWCSRPISRVPMLVSISVSRAQNQ